VFENRVLRKKRDEVTGERRRQHNEELHDFFTDYYSGGQLKSNEMYRACSMYGNQKRCTQGLVGKHERKNQLRTIIFKWIFNKANGGHHGLD
jgi:hypothetical protein